MNLEKDVRRRPGASPAESAPLPGVNDVLVPQDLDYPSLRLDIDRERASLVGLSQKEVVDNVITALTSNQMIAPSYWVDPKTGNDYMLTVQYPENQIRSISDLKQIPSARFRIRESHAARRRGEDPGHRGADRGGPLSAPPRHRRLRDAEGEDLGRLAAAIEGIVAKTKLPEGVRVDLRGSVQGMRASFRSFGLGLILSVALVYLILVAQFSSFLDPFIILLAIPPGLTGVLLILLAVRKHAQRDVADGRDHDGRHRRLEQHPHRRIHADSAAGRHSASTRRSRGLPHPDCARS